MINLKNVFLQRTNLKRCQAQESVNIFTIRRRDKGERDEVEGVKMQRGGGDGVEGVKMQRGGGNGSGVWERGT